MQAYSENTKCRVCLQDNENMKLLSAEYLICGDLISISDIIIFCTSIPILEADKFPKYICCNCLQDANIAYSFKKRCEQTQDYLNTWLEESDTKNDNNCLEEAAGTVFLPTDEKKIETFLCTQCPIKFTSTEELEEHILSTHKQNNDKYFCKFCSKFYNSEKKLNSHMIIHAKNTLRAMRRSNSNKRSSNSEKDNPSNSESDSNNYSDIDNIVNDHSDDNDSDDKEESNNKNEEAFVYVKNNEDVETIELAQSADKILKFAREKNENGFFECICCEAGFEEPAELKNHLQNHSIFKCKLCSKSFTFVSNLRRHLKSYKAKIKTELNDESAEIAANGIEFKCIACDAVFSRRKQLSDHLKTYKEFICKICNAKFTFATNLRKHLHRHIKPKEEIRVWKQLPIEKRICDICFKVFKYRPSMLKHRKKHEVSGKSCKFCDEIFDNAVKLYRHMEEKHEKEKNIVCTECGKKFFKEWNLKMHMAVHTGAKPYLCEICGASFALGGNLASHKRLHTGIKPYKCETCGRTFAQQAALRSHEAGHSNRKDYICPDCGTAFSRAGAMRNHRKRHDTTKPIKCTMCDKRFTFRSERKRHMAVHTGERNHVCDFCGKAFNRPTSLTVHRRIHTGELPYQCDVCGKGFVQAHCMRAHRNTHVQPENTTSASINQMDQLQNEHLTQLT